MDENVDNVDNVRAPDPALAPDAGGRGEPLADPHRARGQMLLVRKAAREAWGVSENMRKLVMATTGRIIVNKDADGQPLGHSARTVLRACELVVTLDRLDLDKAKYVDAVPTDGEEARVIRTPLPGPPEGVPDERKE